MKGLDYALAWQNALDLATYWQEFQDKLQNPQHDDPYAAYLPLNWQRVQRIYKHMKLSAAWEVWAKESTPRFRWLVITEPWCGDAAQILPVLDQIAALGKIQLKVVYRDQNTEIMDQHLTHGSRSIPKIIALSTDFQYLGDWGPRPAEAIALRSQFPDDPKAYADALHLWYARNKQVAIQEEVLSWTKTLN